MDKYQKALNELKLAVNYPNSSYNDIRLVKIHLNTLQELIERATPKKPTKDLLRCPNCNHKVGFDYYDDKHVDYCTSCGQALDWGEEK